jgi:hypothetical protein
VLAFSSHPSPTPLIDLFHSKHSEFRSWFAEFDSAAWDQQMEADLSSGKLDALLDEAEEDFRTGPRREV